MAQASRPRAFIFAGETPAPRAKHANFRSGVIPLWMAVVLAIVAVIGLAYWTHVQKQPVTSDGRTELVFWGVTTLGEDIYGALQQFENQNPQYRVTYSNGAARDITGDAQRLMCAIAGGVPPDVVWFDRFAVGEWAGRGALTDLTPFIKQQSPDDPERIRPEEFYSWALDEASYKKPQEPGPKRLYAIPTDSDIRVLFVNSDIFRQNGLADAKGDPIPPKNWDELRAYASKLTVYRHPGDKHSGIVRLGYGPDFGNPWLYMYVFQAGGNLISEDGRTCTMDTPPVIKALKFMTDIDDDLGGVAQVGAFREASQGNSLDPFLTGQVAMKIDVDNSMRIIADWNPKMDFKLFPAPLPQEEIDKGKKPIGWSGGYSYVIPATSRNKEGAFKLLKFLSSWHAEDLIERGRREQRESEGRMYLPNIHANRVHFERLVKQYVYDNPNLPQTYKDAYQVTQELLPTTRIRPVTPVGQFLWAQQVRAMDAGPNHAFAEQAKREGKDETEMVLAEMQAPVQKALDEIYSPPPPTVVEWKGYIVGYIALLAVPFLAIFAIYKSNRKLRGYRGREVAAAMLFLSPWVIGFALFVGGPVLFSIVFSFSRYDILSPARYVGLQNYIDVFKDPVFYKSVINTGFMILRVPLGMAVSLMMALLLNRAVRGVGWYRAAFYLPAIVPLVASSFLWMWLLNPSFGTVNEVLAWIITSPIGHAAEWSVSLFTSAPFHFSLPLWLKDPAMAKPSLIVMGLWSSGGTMIIWLAGLQSIPPQLYEAASIDGAGKWQQFWNVTIPMISPYILFNLIIGTIGTLQIFQESYIMTEGGPADSTLFYAYYLFKQAFQFFQMGYASALAWILFIVVLSLTLLELWLSNKWVHYEQA